MKKERIFYLDFIRAISILSIVIYHFDCSISVHSISNNEIFFSNYANLNLGNMGVSLFFIISGASLMYVYSEKINIKEFFKKRFISLYPMFWIAYSITFLYLFYTYKTINHSIPKENFILTIIGMDGYLGGKIPNFYILGEWFLGCIILLYLIFPILRLLMIKKPKVTLICISIVYILIVKNYNLDMEIDHNFIIRIMDFTFGMYFATYIKKVNMYRFIGALILFMFVIFINININKMYLITITGIVLFYILVYLSQYIKNKKIWMTISQYSYALFLTHHVIMEHIIARFDGAKITRSETYCLFIITCIVIAILAIYLYRFTNKINKYFKNTKFISKQREDISTVETTILEK